MSDTLCVSVFSGCVGRCCFDVEMMQARVEFNLCTLLFFGALVEGNLR